MFQQNIIILIIGGLIAIALIYYKKKFLETSQKKPDFIKKTQKIEKQQNLSPIKNNYQDQLIQRKVFNGSQQSVSPSKIRFKTPSPIKSQVKPIVNKNSQINQINSNISIQQQNIQSPQQIIAPIIYNNSQITFPTNQPTVKQVIFDLYNKSCNKRSSGGKIKFIGPTKFGQSFISDFMLEGTQIANSLYMKIKGYRKVRGDGNCYYTAIAFQYFRILLTKYNDNQFQQILKAIEEMNLMVYYTNFMLQPNMQNQLAKALVELLQVLRFDSSSLEQIMSDPNQEFYGLAIIFLKNLANNLYVQDSQIRNIYQPDLSGEILTWEYQCNNTEMLNSALAKYLKVNIKVYFIDRMNDELIVFSYGEESWSKIHLLFEPGHYDIGIVQLDEH